MRPMVLGLSFVAAIAVKRESTRLMLPTVVKANFQPISDGEVFISPKITL